MNQKISTGVGVIIIIIIALTAGVFVWKFSQQNSAFEAAIPVQKPKANKAACTMEAKLCPDGSYVSRSGLNCEFAACPGESAVDTSNWQTYRNTKYGFEFDYPPTFGVLNDKIKFRYPSLPDWHVIELGNENNEAQPHISVHINPDGYGPGFPDRELVVDESSEGKLIIKSESSAVLPDPDYEDGVFRYTTNIRSKNGNYYQIFFTANEGPDDYYQLFKQILSTFKFTN